MFSKQKTRVVNETKVYFFLFIERKPINSLSLILKNEKMNSTSKNQTPEYYQNVVVMRHGDRVDNFDPLWISTAQRPWDPPLVQEGRVRSFCTGRKFRNVFKYQLHRVYVSPFLRCVQTAAEAVIALSAVDDSPEALTGESVRFDPSKIKVHQIALIHHPIILILF